MPSPLEAQLAALTQEFVTKLVDAIRNASFADVAALSGSGARPPASGRSHAAPALPASRRVVKRPSGEQNGTSRERQTASRRAELADRVVHTLESAGKPLGVRAIAEELSVPVDLLVVPLRELRTAGRIHKHGEKRSTTYSV
jgi:hypothetical protein